MKDDILNKVFDNSQKDFDIESPNFGHEQRFLEKLNQNNSKKVVRTKFRWQPILSVAASIVLLVSVFMFSNKKDTPVNLKSISPEMAKTESVFMASLSKELEQLNSEDMPEHQELIVETLFQIKILEEDFNQLVIGLRENPKDQLILSAMILNFQRRIDVLQSTKDTINILKTKSKQVKTL